jgi:transposase
MRWALAKWERLGRIDTRANDIDRLCKRMQSKAFQLVFFYEAGPCGYALYLQLTSEGARSR